MNAPTREAVNPPVQGAEYPKMLYRDGDGLGHVHIDKPLLVENEHQVDCTLVWNLDEEMLALDEGWRLTANPKGSVRREDARDAMIRELREQLEASNAMAEVGEITPRRPGRPRKEVSNGDAA